MGYKQKFVLGITAAVITLLLVGCGLSYYPETKLAVSDEYMAASAPAVEHNTDISSAESTGITAELPEESLPKEPWHTVSQLIYHACGGIDGVSYTNSKEALEATLSRGNMLVEVDFLFTEDGYLICGHKWSDIIPVEESKISNKKSKKTEETVPEVKCTLDVFETLKIKGNYTGLTGENIISYMDENPDLYIIIDTKEENLDLVIMELLRLCDYRKEIADRFVIQLYDRDQKKEIMELYPFPEDNFLFTCYKFDPVRVEEILQICDAEQIRVVTVAAGSWPPETVSLFLEKGIVLFEHTVNVAEEAVPSLQNGIYGFYTDFLQESELNDIIYQKMEQ